MKKLKTITFWQIAYWIMIVYGYICLGFGVFMYTETKDDGWLFFALNGGLVSTALTLSKPEFE
jgi:hypothetical protein